MRQLFAASVKDTFSEPTKYEEPLFQTMEPGGSEK